MVGIKAIVGLVVLLAAQPALAAQHLWRIVWDVDFFGGEEDREPWADIVN